jgi:ankyrin repeat protein
LSRGANPNHAGNAGDTALHVTARKGFVSVADALFRNKAELEAKNGSAKRRFTTPPVPDDPR